MRNLLFVVRVRVLARRAELVSVQREDAGGRLILVIRGADARDLRAQIAPSARHTLERTNAVTFGRTQLRLDLEALGDAWRDALVQALEALAPEDVAVPA